MNKTKGKEVMEVMVQQNPDTSTEDINKEMLEMADQAEPEQAMKLVRIMQTKRVARIMVSPCDLVAARSTSQRCHHLG